MLCIIFPDQTRIYPQKIIVNVGESVRFSCTSSTSIQITFVKESTGLAGTTMVDEVESISITNIKHNDQGICVCIEKVGNGGSENYETFAYGILMVRGNN